MPPLSVDISVGASATSTSSGATAAGSAAAPKPSVSVETLVEVASTIGVAAAKAGAINCVSVPPAPPYLNAYAGLMFFDLSNAASPNAISR